MTVYVSGFKEAIPDDAIVVNTTSRSTNLSRGLSPFLVGPVNLYGGQQALNHENGWQFSKTYRDHIGLDGNPTEQYFEWARKGWADSYAHRYPMGRGAVPEYSYWDGEHLSYIEARKRIYIPLYSEAVRKTEAYQQLKKLVENESGRDVYLQDFDAYNHKIRGMTYDEVIECETRKMGHAFVLAMMLDKFL